ncbi:uncharacterized protein LOC115553307 isoform X3 [Gadus morhua]|uniref:uncharacterized protein LOC115553307 isoform X3 n=1 Tax=Gadus morhua TaxID=8049 RepID=UPI0011B5E8BC|nr:uncharacterized protein LOC115553307 isoform X3 [Gadus morhua]
MISMIRRKVQKKLTWGKRIAALSSLCNMGFLIFCLIGTVGVVTGPIALGAAGVAAVAAMAAAGAGAGAAAAGAGGATAVALLI